MIILALILLGLALGSFANAFVWRLHEQQERLLRAGKRGHAKTDTRNLSILTGRSMCTYCGHELAVKDLVPVLSYLWLRGKCRYCRKPINDTPLAELLTPVAFVASYLWWPYDLYASGLTSGRVLFGFWLVFLVGFVILTLYDMRWFLLPDKVVLPLIVLALLQVAVRSLAFGGGRLTVLGACWGVLCIAGLFYMLYVVSRGTWIGFGDVKLGIVLGALVGGPANALLLIFLASLFGSLAAVPMLIKGNATAKSHIPFGPFLMLATVATMLFGEHITSWYAAFLLLR